MLQSPLRWNHLPVSWSWGARCSHCHSCRFGDYWNHSPRWDLGQGYCHKTDKRKFCQWWCVSELIWFVILCLVFAVFHGCKSRTEISCSAAVNYAVSSNISIRYCKSRRGRSVFFSVSSRWQQFCILSLNKSSCTVVLYRMNLWSFLSYHLIIFDFLRIFLKEKWWWYNAARDRAIDELLLEIGSQLTRWRHHMISASLYE